MAAGGEAGSLAGAHGADRPQWPPRPGCSQLSGRCCAHASPLLLTSLTKSFARWFSFPTAGSKFLAALAGLAGGCLTGRSGQPRTPGASSVGVATMSSEQHVFHAHAARAGAPGAEVATGDLWSRTHRGAECWHTEGERGGEDGRGRCGRARARDWLAPGPAGLSGAASRGQRCCRGWLPGLTGAGVAVHSLDVLPVTRWTYCPPSAGRPRSARPPNARALEARWSGART